MVAQRALVALFRQCWCMCVFFCCFFWGEVCVLRLTLLWSHPLSDAQQCSSQFCSQNLFFFCFTSACYTGLFNGPVKLIKTAHKNMHIGVCECDKNVNCNHIYITFDLYAGYTHPVLIDFVVCVCVCACVCVCMFLVMPPHISMGEWEDIRITSSICPFILHSRSVTVKGQNVNVCHDDIF